MTHTKPLLALLLFLTIIISIFIARAVSVRRHGITWLEELDSRITPLALEEIISAETPGPLVPAPCEPRGAPGAVPASVEISMAKETRSGSRMRSDLERGIDLLPKTGHMGKSYFMRLAEEMEDCCLKLRSPEPGLRHRGELICHRLARQMVEDRSSCDDAALVVMDRYMFMFTDEIREICLRRDFPPSRERSEFTLWAASLMGNGEKNVLLFSIRLLGIMGEGSPVEAIRRYRRSDDQEIRSAAVWAMGMQGSPDAIDEIEDILSDKTLSTIEGEAFLVALGRIGGARASGVLCGVMRSSPPLLAYDAYLSLRELRGQAGQPLSIEEFERDRGAVVDEYAEWLEN